MNIFIKKPRRYRSGALIPALLALAAALALLRLASMPEPEESIIPRSAPAAEPQVTLYRHQSGEVTALALEDYVLGVVMAEMPLLFGGEALKAQAVCARTYALRGMTAARDFPGGADLSDDVQECQSYVSLMDYQARNPEVDEELLALATQAVAATRGEILLYKKTLADTVYHASCGGQTAAAAEVWGGESVPYLRSVRCPGDACRDYRQTTAFNASELGRLLEVPADVSRRVWVRE
ncbi:MAG: SpoIID/LytB domain-containing protein [Syntrophomonadaceae bacterium]|nr:SpoIID/LytB domain-containing protein [Syntrophomonadaceae bacterium]